MPARKGTEAVMEGCHLHRVKRLVLTSSLMSVQCMKPENMPANLIFTDKHWSDPVGDHLNAYAKSKTIAEKVAWDFQNALPEAEQTELVVINPGMIIGPAFVGAGFTSG